MRQTLSLALSQELPHLILQKPNHHPHLGSQGSRGPAAVTSEAGV